MRSKLIELAANVGIDARGLTAREVQRLHEASLMDTPFRDQHDMALIVYLHNLGRSIDAE